MPSKSHSVWEARYRRPSKKAKKGLATSLTKETVSNNAQQPFIAIDLSSDLPCHSFSAASTPPARSLHAVSRLGPFSPPLSNPTGRHLASSERHPEVLPQRSPSTDSALLKEAHVACSSSPTLLGGILPLRTAATEGPTQWIQRPHPGPEAPSQT